MAPKTFTNRNHTMIKLSDSIALPPSLATLTSAILGVRGSGKTNTGGVIVEDFIAQGVQVVVVDPLDVWWGLKSSASGELPGIPVVIFGGHHGDLPLHSDSAKLVAEVLVENRLSAVLSLRHLSKSAQRRFVGEFAEQVYQLKGKAKNRTPLNIAIDEASSFIPQRFQSDMAKTVGAIEDLVRRGRSSGIGVTLIDQRAASVNKDVLTQIEILIAHRHTSPQDRNALKEWVNANADTSQLKDFLETLSMLKTGEAWVWSPGEFGIFERTQIRLRSTFDSSSTPDIDDPEYKPVKMADVDLSAIETMLASQVEEVKANDPKALQSEIARLKSEITELKNGSGTAHLVQEIDKRDWVLAEVAEILERSLAICRSLATNRPLKKPESDGRDLPRIPETPKPIRSIKDGQISSLMQSLLNAIANLHKMGVDAPPLAHVGIVAGKSANAGPVRGAFTRLEDQGLIQRLGDSVSLTDLGHSLASPIGFSTLKEAHEFWLSGRTKLESDIARVLIRCYPKGETLENIGVDIGKNINAGPVRGAINSLVKAGVAERVGKDRLVATGYLFPRGLSRE